MAAGEAGRRAPGRRAAVGSEARAGAGVGAEAPAGARVGAGSAALVEDEGRVVAADGRELALAEMRPDQGGAAAAGAPAFLLLHGFAQNRRAFTLGALPAELAARGGRVFLGELRGHGASRRDAPETWSLSTHLELDCPALLDGARGAAGVERVHLMGHSMGGLLGCALLARGAPLASLTLFGTPLLLGAHRPLVRLASFLGGPLAQVAPRGRRLPMDLFLRALATPLSAPGAWGPLRWLQQLTRLANPALADPAALQEILAHADPESPAVMEELARNAVLLRSRLAGIDLVEALRATPLPVAAVVGTSDIFAPRAAVAPFDEDGHAGPRTILEVEGGTHVDVTMGHHIPETVAALWDFLRP